MAYTSINKPTDYFNTVLYTGDGNSTQAISGVGFQPDMVWLKARNHAYSHQLFDVVRGATKLLNPEATDVEQTLSGVTSFDSDGFTVGSDAGSNGSAKTFASWNWYTGTTASSNTDGSITSTVSANTTSGFSIVSFTGNGSAGSTIGHGLGSTPSCIIVKNRDSGTDIWTVYHIGTDASIPQNKFMQVDDTSAVTDSTLPWNDTAPTSSVFTVGTYSSTNGSSQNMIAYCFAEKKGFSKFGSYTGNGSTDGAFVYCGFKPAWVMTKKTSASGNGWVMIDNKRETTNDDSTNYLIADTNVVETNASFAVDFLSNGFKPRTNSGGTNNSGATYIYMAFAESPFTTSTGTPTTAR